MRTIDNLLQFVNYYAEKIEQDTTGALDALRNECNSDEKLLKAILFLIASVYPRHADVLTNHMMKRHVPNTIDLASEYQVEFQIRRAITEECLTKISTLVSDGKLKSAVKETLNAVAMLVEFSIMLSESGYRMAPETERFNGISGAIKNAQSQLNSLNVSVIVEDQDQILSALIEFRKSVMTLEGLVQEILISKF